MPLGGGVTARILKSPLSRSRGAPRIRPGRPSSENLPPASEQDSCAFSPRYSGSPRFPAAEAHTQFRPGVHSPEPDGCAHGLRLPSHRHPTPDTRHLTPDTRPPPHATRKAPCAAPAPAMPPPPHTHPKTTKGSRLSDCLPIGYLFRRIRERSRGAGARSSGYRPCSCA